ERPLEGILAAVVLDVVYDVASFALGHDLLTGEKLSHGEELFTAVAIAIPVVSIAAVKQSGRLLQGGKQVAMHVDEAGDAAKFAARHADELKDGTRVAAKHGDELLERAAWSARHGDDLAESQTLTRRLDNWVSPDGPRLGDEALQRQRLTRQADGYGTRDTGFGGRCAIPTHNSFTAGTLVDTESGQKPIEEIQVGDKVLGEDPETGEQGYYEVVSVRSHLKDEIVKVTIETEDGGETTQEVMETTSSHPVYVEEKGWMWAENLEAGDKLRTADDSWAEVVAVEHVQLEEPELVYNFTVKGPHTYFVLEMGVLVHNERACKDNWFWNQDVQGNIIVGRGNTRSDVLFDELDDFYLGYSDQYGHIWTDGLDQVFGRMSPDDVRFFAGLSGSHGTFTVVGGLSETLDGTIIREMIYEEFAHFNRAEMHAETIIKEMRLQGASQRQIDAILERAAELRQQFHSQVKAAYGIDFPHWRHTGAPSTNTKYAGQADIDAWLHGRRTISPEFQRAINEYFGLPSGTLVDNYNKYANYNWWKPPGTTFYTDGRLIRNQSTWDDFNKLSPQGQQKFWQIIDQRPRANLTQVER
ncbi:MAG: hypothetical protein IT327_09895, partial [Anaerolineae bacterium]|nr:hypothetical protein [Anaerolineae bacterium]